jgi:alpha-ketoglutarate-dependent taurine dioxygenase
MKLIEAGGRKLADVSDDEVKTAFVEHGLVIFRGFDAKPADFDVLARRFTKEHFFGYGRAPFADFKAITNVNETNLPLEPHCDNGIRPEAQRPKITWFLCERPADEAGETTFHDGIVVWERLQPATRELFAAKKVSFLSQVAEQAWRQLGCTSPEQFGQFVGKIGGRVARVHPNHTVDVEVLSSAVHTPAWSQRDAFVSSLLVAGSVGFEGMRVSLEGGQAVPPEALADLRAALASCLEVVSWQAGDIGMLDNSRFLHGRRGFTDTKRRVYLIQTLHANF